MYGGPYTTYVHDFLGSHEDMWEALHAHKKNKDIITAGTPGISDTQFNEDGLA